MKVVGHFVFDQPFVSLVITGETVELLLDTGFNGQLMLPTDFLDRTGSVPVGEAEYVTADGNVMSANVYEVGILWFGERKRIYAVGTNSPLPLMGMGLLKRCRTLLDPRNAALIIEP